MWLAHGGRCASGAEHENRRDATNRCAICAAGFPPGLEAAPPPSPSLWRTLRVSFRPDGHETGFRPSRKCTKMPHDATPLNLRTMSLVGSPCAFVLFNLASQVALCLFSRPAQPWVFVSFRVAARRFVSDDAAESEGRRRRFRAVVADETASGAGDTDCRKAIRRAASFRVPREAPSKSQPLDRAAQRHSREPDRPEIWYNMRILKTTA